MSQTPLLIAYANSYAQLVNAPWGLLEVLRYDLAYMAQSAYVPSADDGWDGWLRLLAKDGSLPAGLVPELQRLLDKYGVPFVVRDMRQRPDDEVPLHSGLKLRDYQERLVDKALRLGRGIIDSPPRSGKTMMGSAIVDRNPLPALWIAPTKAIVRQTVRSLSKALALGPGGVVEVTGGWPAPKKQRAVREARVVVTTAASAVRFPRSFYDSRDVLVIDEFHHAAASTYQEINRVAENVYYRYGLTGTHFRSDANTEILMDAVLSTVIGRVEVQQLVDLGFLCPVDFVFVPIEGPRLGECALDTAYRRGVMHHKDRNAWVSWAAQALMAYGKRVIVLVKLIDHGEQLAELIPGAHFVRGADGKDVRDEDVTGAIESFNRGEIPCLIGTSVLGEGIDLPAADALVYAKGGSADVTVTQDVFRVLTASTGKSRALVVDFADRHHDGLKAQSAKRGRIYAREDAFDVHVLDRPAALDPFLRRVAGPPSLI